MRQDPTKGPIGNYILDLLKLVLHSMHFEFNNESLQIGGTSMGIALAHQVMPVTLWIDSKLRPYPITHYNP